MAAASASLANLTASRGRSGIGAAAGFPSVDPAQEYSPADSTRDQSVVHLHRRRHAAPFPVRAGRPALATTTKAVDEAHSVSATNTR